MNSLSLKNIALNITDGEHGTVKDDIEGEYFYLSNKNIIDNNVIYDKNDRKISKDTFEKINKRIKLEKDDLLLSTVGTIGKTVIVKEQPNYTFQRSVGIIKINKKLADPYYIKYYLDTPIIQKKLNQIANGGVQKGLYISDLENLKIDIPSIQIQKKIANSLKILDDKIDINNKIINESEKLAKKIYDYWFVQFEFPDKDIDSYKSSGGKMIYNEILKKNIPENWTVEQIKNCIKNINTGLNPRNNFKLGNGTIKYVTVKNLTLNGNIDFSNCDVIDEQAKLMVHNRSKVEKGDILFASISPLGRCVIVNEEPKDWDINESVFCIKPNFNKISSEYLYLYFMRKDFIKKAEHSSTGSVFNGIRIKTLEDMFILIPQKNVIDKFTNIVSNIFMLKYNKIKENEILYNLKNYLLPLLINGQVRFKD